MSVELSTVPSAAASSASGVRIVVPDEAAMARLAAVLAAALRGGEFIALSGPLGAGKTTLARGLLRAAGHAGPVRSPTFTLVEPYEFAAFTVLHLDLYRLGDADELEMLGVRERFGEAVLLIEWPERGAGWLPPPDLALTLAFEGEGRSLTVAASSVRGEPLVQALQRALAADPAFPAAGDGAAPAARTNEEGTR